jgi:hypothetical protein
MEETVLDASQIDELDEYNLTGEDEEETATEEPVKEEEESTEDAPVKEEPIKEEEKTSDDDFTT